MTYKKIFSFITIVFFYFNLSTLVAQIKPGTYLTEVENVIHEIKINETYFSYTSYKNKTGEFIATLGGFSRVEKISSSLSHLIVLLEFNSEFAKDSINRLSIPIKMEDEKLQLNWFEELSLAPSENTEQDLDGLWLFGTRGPDTGQKRRGDSKTRKTLKFLINGRFQWVAFDTDTMQFKGTGGGSFTSEDGIYTEQIEYFSRDNKRVGASLKFNYALKNQEWHHTGNNSKGEPMHEIWERRK